MLPRLFERVVIPPTVFAERQQPNTPAAVQQWVGSLLIHARSVIEAWRREYNEERPKRVLGGLTPAEYAKRLTVKERMETPE